MLAALTYGLVLFLIVAIAISTRAWLREQLSVFAPLPGTPDRADLPPTADPDNIITIADWQAARDQRRAREAAAQEASG